MFLLPFVFLESLFWPGPPQVMFFCTVIIGLLGGRIDAALDRERNIRKDLGVGTHKKIQWWKIPFIKGALRAHWIAFKHGRGKVDMVTVGTTEGGFEVVMSAKMAMEWAEMPLDVRAKILASMEQSALEDPSPGMRLSPKPES